MTEKDNLHKFDQNDRECKFSDTPIDSNDIQGNYFRSALKWFFSKLAGKVSETPVIISTPEKLRTDLERLGSSLEENKRLLEQIGIIQNGELSLINGERRGYESWGKIADIIKSDEKLQMTITRLERGRSGLPVVMPDITPCSLGRRVCTTEKQVHIFSDISSTFQTDMSLAPKEFGEILDMQASRIENEVVQQIKTHRLQAGEFGNGKLGVIFVDSGQEVPYKTKNMDASQFLWYCHRTGCTPIDIEIYHAMNLIANSKGQHFDSKSGSWLTRYIHSRDMCYGEWYQHSKVLNLYNCDKGHKGPNLGGRRSVRVFKNS